MSKTSSEQYVHLFGTHINDNTKYINLELARISNLKCNLVQLFVYPNIKDKTVYQIFKKNLIERNMHCVVHASYTINLAKDWTEYSVWIRQFIDEIEMASFINADAIVIHCGKQLDLTKEQAYNNMYTSLLYIHNQTKKFNIKILIETSSGQGSELLSKIEDLAYFFKKFSLHRNIDIQNRFRICLDTCHVFQSGYDIRTKKMIYDYLNTFETLIGLKYISLVHLNDSKKDIGYNVDRHENLGKGYIGKIGLKIISSFFKKYSVPVILETPGLYHTSEIKDYLL